MNVDQVMIALLALDAMIVMYGLSRRKNMWSFIVLYWIILFTKNAVNFIFPL